MPPPRGGALGEGAHLGHQVVMDLGLDLERARDVDLVHVGAQVGGLGGRHQPVFGLGLGQRHPQPAPEQALVVLGPDAAHGIRTVAPGKRGLVGGEVSHMAFIE